MLPSRFGGDYGQLRGGYGGRDDEETDNLSNGTLGPSTSVSQHRPSVSASVTSEPLIDINSAVPSSRQSGLSSQNEQQYHADAYNVPVAGDPYDFTALLKENARLQADNKELREKYTDTDDSSRWHTLYRVQCPYSGTGFRTYADRPVIARQDSHDHVDCFRRIPDERSWEKAHKDYPFVVYKYYVCGPHEEQATDTSPVAQSEQVKILSSTLYDTVQRLLHSQDGLDVYERDGVFYNGAFQSPYVVLHHFEDEVDSFLHTCGLERQDLSLLITYMKEQSKPTAVEAESSFREGQAAWDMLPYLFKPTSQIVATIGDDLMVMTLSSLLTRHQDQWLCNATMITFDGEFRHQHQQLSIPQDQRRKFSIMDLPFYPLSYLDEAQRLSLLSRGKMFYKCRKQQYVTARRREDSGRDNTSNVRYMVDVEAYHMIHARDSETTDRRGVHVDPQPGDDIFLLQLPALVEGFHMLDKKWVTLRVADMKPVTWNKQAFEDLVISNDHDSDTKGLIRALVQNKIEADEGIDFVNGKGTGLVVLLHGAPGSGKTLTAESVAEIAQKPLYRVTCGDIGTKPEEVEKYLELVFLLGRRWGSVVLLDEADVFLEARSHTNLERNALVSVFLRAMEYYDGILILTSNRVGHFDEAFKSRVQLALPYKPLTKGQRTQIWKNFIRMLQSVDEHMDVEEITAKVDRLASFDINGRQIRNAINTARQLARYNDKEPLRSAHLERALKVTQQFDKYIQSVQHPGISAEQMAYESGDR